MSGTAMNSTGGQTSADGHGAGNQTQGQRGGGGAPSATDLENLSLSNYLLFTLAVISAILIVWRVATGVNKYLRHVTCLHSERQQYFANPDSKLSWLKRNVIYAPLFRKRHNREFQLSSAINVGTLPTRLQFVFLFGYLATNAVFCLIDIPFAASYTQAAQTFRNRTGTLAVINMIPLFVMVGRNNPLIRLLGISFDTFNLLHRWLGRVVVLESIAHSAAHLAKMAAATNWAASFQTVVSVPYMMWGLIATCAFITISLQAMSIVRHAFYETFKIIHILLAILALAALWFHLSLENLPQLKYLPAIIAIWAFDRFIRLVLLAYHNVGHGGTRTLVEALPGNACRVTVNMARPWSFKPGQHAYLYMPGIGYWTSHPFSVAWTDEAEPPTADTLPMDRQDVLAIKKSTMSFIVRGRTGFTNSLYKRAAACTDGKMTATCLVEGPYGGLHQMGSYGSVMLVAGGVGITHVVPYVRDLVAGHSNGTVATRKVVLVWVIQSPDHLEWIRPWMTEILAMEKRREVLRVLLFVSRPRSTKEIHSPSSTVQMFPGRPNIDTLLGIEMENQIGALGVIVCGPGALSDEVRLAVRRRQYQGTVDLVEEAFSW